MKKTIALLLALALCLSLCACGSNQSASNNNVSATIPVIYPGTGGEKIEFDDLVLAEDDKVKISLVEFYTNKMISAGNSDGGKCATFKVENKTDREMAVNVIPYLDNESLTAALVDGGTAVEAGRVGRMGFSFTYGTYPNWTDLDSLDELYELEFTFDLAIGFGTSNSETHKVSCSVADALNGNSSSDSLPETNSNLYGTWEVTEVDTGSIVSVEEWEAVNLYSFSDWQIVVSRESGLYLQTNNLSIEGTDVVIGETNIIAGSNNWVLEGDRLVLVSGDLTLYYEKISDNESFPELRKQELVDMLNGKWVVSTSDKNGSFTFRENYVTVDLNGLYFDSAALNVIMSENRINFITYISDQQISMDLYYNYENGILTITYDGATLVRS